MGHAPNFDNSARYFKKGDEVIFKLLPEHPHYDFQVSGAKDKFHSGTVIFINDFGVIFVESETSMFYHNGTSCLISFFPQSAQSKYPERTNKHHKVTIIKKVSSPAYDSKEFWVRAGPNAKAKNWNETKQKEVLSWD